MEGTEGRGLFLARDYLEMKKVKFKPFKLKAQINKWNTRSHSRVSGMMSTVMERRLHRLLAPFLKLLVGFLP